MSNNSTLVGDGHDDIGGFVKDDALASEAAFEARVVGAVNEIFLFVADFFEKLVAAFDVNMARRASANAAAVVVEMHAKLLRDF